MSPLPLLSFTLHLASDWSENDNEASDWLLSHLSPHIRSQPGRDNKPSTRGRRIDYKNLGQEKILFIGAIICIVYTRPLQHHTFAPGPHSCLWLVRRVTIVAAHWPGLSRTHPGHLTSCCILMGTNDMVKRLKGANPVSWFSCRTWTLPFICFPSR